MTYNKQLTALFVIDPYNGFISEGGKVWDRLKGVVEANNCVPHMLQALKAARKAGVRTCYAGLTEKECAVLEALMILGKNGNLAYFAMMTARPQTVGYGATDSPAACGGYR